MKWCVSLSNMSHISCKGSVSERRTVISLCSFIAHHHHLIAISIVHLSFSFLLLIHLPPLFSFILQFALFLFNHSFTDSQEQEKVQGILRLDKTRGREKKMTHEMPSNRLPTLQERIARTTTGQRITFAVLCVILIAFIVAFFLFERQIFERRLAHRATVNAETKFQYSCSSLFVSSPRTSCQLCSNIGLRDGSDRCTCVCNLYLPNVW